MFVISYLQHWLMAMRRNNKHWEDKNTHLSKKELPIHRLMINVHGDKDKVQNCGF